MADKTITFQELKDKIQKFTKERDWEQFHTPKNLSMALASEAAELMEHFLWSESKDSMDRYKEREKEIKEEVADIIIYLLCFCNATGIDISDAILNKIKINASKYPVDKCKGKCLKYNEL
jgi:dCTP diphosphatase